MVEVGSLLMQGELVHKTAAGFDRFLADPRHAIHTDRDLKPVPVHRGGLGEVIIEDDVNAVPLGALNGWPGRSPVITPYINRFIGSNLLLHRLRDQMKHFDTV